MQIRSGPSGFTCTPFIPSGVPLIANSCIPSGTTFTFNGSFDTSALTNTVDKAIKWLFTPPGATSGDIASTGIDLPKDGNEPNTVFFLQPMWTNPVVEGDKLDLDIKNAQLSTVYVYGNVDKGLTESVTCTTSDCRIQITAEPAQTIVVEQTTQANDQEFALPYVVPRSPSLSSPPPSSPPPVSSGPGRTDCLAQSGYSLSSCLGSALGIPTGGTTQLSQVIVITVYILMLIGVVLAVAFLLYGALKWITSGGDKQKLEEARKTVTYSIIGLIVIISALVIVTILGGILQAPFIAPPRLP